MLRIAPLDGLFEGAEGEYETLIDLYHIPDQFVLEREQSVTHSLGRHLGSDRLESKCPSPQPIRPRLILFSSSVDALPGRGP